MAKKEFSAISSDNYKNIPVQIKQISQWKTCYKEGAVDPKGNTITTPKRPIGGPTVDFNVKSWADIESEKPDFFGFCLHKDDDFIGIDVDDLPQDFTTKDLDETLLKFLHKHPTYVERSPSGRGLHIWYEADKSKLKHRKAADQGTRFKGAVYLRDQFLTMTGDVFEPLSEAVINPVDPLHLESELMHPGKVIQLRQQDYYAPQRIPTMDELKAALLSIPQTLSTSPHQDKIKEVYKNFSIPIDEISDYEHWRLMLCAIHDLAANHGDVGYGLELADEWSSYDQINYKGFEAVQDKYHENPPSYDGTDKVTWKTLFKIKQAVNIVWPVVKPKSSRPLLSNMANWESFFNHYNLKMSLNEVTKRYTIVGNKYVIDKYFPVTEYEDLDKYLLPVLHYFANVSDIPEATRDQTRSGMQWWLVSPLTETHNPIKSWIENASAYDPDTEPDYFDQLWSCVHTQREDPIHKIYLKKNLMGLIRAHFYTGPHRETTGIVIFTGAENTRKSTFVRNLLPQDMQHDYILASQLTSNKNEAVKELQMEAAQAQIWMKDEVEILLKTADAKFKNTFVQATDSFRYPYARSPTNIYRKCIFFGTTNEDKLYMTDKGSRRIQMIPITYMDTDKQKTIDPLNIYRQLLFEFNNTPVDKQPYLWILTEDEIDMTNHLNYNEYAAERDHDMYLKETYCVNEVEYPGLDEYLTKRGALNKKHPQIKTLTNIAHDIRNKTGANILPNKALTHAVHRVFGAWTGSIKPIDCVSFVVDNGQILQTDSKGKRIFSKYITPPLQNDFEIDDADNEELS